MWWSTQADKERNPGVKAANFAKELGAGKSHTALPAESEAKTFSSNRITCCVISFDFV